MSDRVVHVQSPADGIVQVTMQERVNKNTFTDELIREPTQTFTEIGRRSDCKAVILTGYDNYFSSGGTQEGLRDLFDGRLRFTDKDLYSLALPSIIEQEIALHELTFHQPEVKERIESFFGK
ncbi:MAG: enoyl-CoA hydratase-related protein [Steroidobacteraceae bacterium]